MTSPSFFVVLLASLLVGGVFAETSTIQSLVTHPHDTAAFTQGLLVDPSNKDYFFEGTGLYGNSQLRRVKIETGHVEVLNPLSRSYFGEGIAIARGQLFQLTWKERIVFIYDLESSEWTPSTKQYPSQFNQGWGLTTNDDDELVLSDGTPNIYYLDPESFRVIGKIRVRNNGRDVSGLNELEWIEGEIWANIWQEKTVAVIDPASGNVRRLIDFRNLSPSNWDADVLNGIAYYRNRTHPSCSKYYVTGKKFNRLWEFAEVREGGVYTPDSYCA